MPISYRPARVEDLVEADSVVVASINELTERRGFGKMASSRPPAFQTFCLQDDPDGLWVAEQDGRITGFAWSWVAGELWFLAQLFVSPAGQGDGTGRTLIRKTFAHAQRHGAATRALITFAFNTVSQGLYIREGLFPRCPLYMVGASRERLDVSRLQKSFTLAPVGDDAALDALAEFDRSSLGISRRKHHVFLARDPAMRGFLVNDGDTLVGYVWIGDGHVGPLAVSRRDALVPALDAALAIAAKGSSASVSAFIPGICEEALAHVLDAGLRITFPMLLMSDRAFGDWERYLPRNPGFM